MKIQKQLEQQLQGLNPQYMEIINESADHGGYYPGKESHFKLTIVSEVFAGLRLVQRHQKVYATVSELLQPSKIHALAIHAYLPLEWQGLRPESPTCAHAPKD